MLSVSWAGGVRRPTCPIVVIRIGATDMPATKNIPASAARLGGDRAGEPVLTAELRQHDDDADADRRQRKA
jgi:hypothetical protein